MKTPRTRRIVPTLMLAAATAMAVVVMSPAAQARDRHGHPRHHRSHHDRHGHHGDHHRHGLFSHIRHHSRFVVPQRIHSHDRRDFRPYFRGSLYYRPHRHHHDVYYFPVYTGHGYSYQPRYYCESELFVGGHAGYHGRDFSIHIDF